MIHCKIAKIGTSRYCFSEYLNISYLLLTTSAYVYVEQKLTTNELPECPLPKVVATGVLTTRYVHTMTTNRHQGRHLTILTTDLHNSNVTIKMILEDPLLRLSADVCDDQLRLYTG